MEQVQTQTQNQTQIYHKIPVIGYQHVCYRIDTLEVIYCPNENKFCKPVKMHPEYIKYEIEVGKYIIIKFIKNVLSYCAEVGLIETNDEGLITEYEMFRRVCSSDERSRDVPKIVREFVLTMLNNYEYHCYYLKSPQEILEHIINELAKRQFSELDTLELLRWLESQDP